MKGSLNFTALLLVWLLCWPLSGSAGSHEILIIKSSENRIFSQTIESLINRSSSRSSYHIVTLSELQQLPVDSQDFKIAVTMGMAAARYARQQYAEKPVLHSFITAAQYQAESRLPGHVSVLLDQPLSRYLLLITALADKPVVGILHAAQRAISAEQQLQLEQKYQLQLVQYLLGANENPIKAARSLLEEVDLLLALPDTKIYNRQSLKGILLTSYRQRKPVITYSPAQVKSGALGAIFSTPQQIGWQLAEVLDQMYKKPVSSLEPFQYARYYDIKINRRVAESLELEIGTRESLLNKMQQIAE